jgi:hypothetical protein
MKDNSFKEGLDKTYSDPNQTPIPSSLGVVKPFPNPMQVKQRITGVSPGPLPSQIPGGSSGPQSFDAKVAALRESRKADIQSYEDKNQWAKAYSYNSGPSGAYYQRYKQFTEPGKRDFHPLIDNESWKNENTNFAGDIYRSITQAFVPMMWNGIKGTVSSTARIFNQGDFLGEDPQLAREYATINAKSYSSKDNLGSFVNNLVINFGYTAGIMATALFENVIGSTIGAFTGAKTLSQRSAQLLAKNYQAGKAVDGIKTYSNALEELKDINNVRQIWNQNNGIGQFQKAITSPVGKVLNPLSNLTDHRYAILNSTDDFAGYMQSGRTFLNTAGAAYRDFRNINLAISEARLESGMVYNTLVNDLYNDFYNKNGKPPNEDETAAIINQAKRASYETAFWNTGLIYVTNKVSFDNILNPRIGNQGFLRQRMVDWKTVGGGRFGEVGNVAFDIAKNEWKFSQKGFASWWSRWKTDPFHKSVWGTVGYFKSNIFEGVQEVFQETISAANEKYYKDTFNAAVVRKNLVTKAAYGENSTPMSYYGKEAKELLSNKEGLAVFASGFAMGTFAGGLNNSMTFLYEKAHQIFDKNTYNEYVQEKTKIATELVDRMNAFGVEELINSKIFNGGAQEILAKVQEAGNKKEVMDAESEAVVNHVTMLNEYGVLDLYLDAVSSYKNLTNEEFKEAFPKVPENEISQYKLRIDDLVTKAKSIKTKLDFYDKVYPNPIDLTKYSKDDVDYEDAYIMHHMWEWGKKSAVFYGEVFDDTRNRMVNIMNKHYEERPLKAMSKRQSDIILRPEEMKNEIGLLRNEAQNLLAVGDAESKKLAKEKLKEVEALDKYLEAYENFTEYYHRDRYFNKAKEILKKDKEEGVEVTDQEVEEFLDDQFGPKDLNVEENILLELEKQYNNLLKSITGQPDDYLFTNTVDDAFELVLDFYKLNDESRQMVDLINLMNDPQGFLDVFERNNKWMTDLWLKRGDYYRDIVTKELSDIEDNGLLNFLAKQGIFMEANDFILYRDQNIPPKEFYDERKALVIPEGSTAYDRYFEVLKSYKALKELEGMMVEQSKKAELEVRIAELVERRDTQLEKLRQQLEEDLVATTGKTREEWEKMQPAAAEGRTQEEIDAETNDLKANLTLIEDAKTIDEVYALYEAFSEQGLIPENYLELIDSAMEANPKEAKNFFKSTKDSGADLETRQQATQHKVGLPQVLKNKIAELAAEEPAAEADTTPPIETTDAWKSYQKQVDATVKRYEALIDKLKAQRVVEEDVKPSEAAPVKKESKKEVSVNSSWDELPQDLKDELQAAFDIFLTEELGKSPELQRVNPTQYEMIRGNWLDTQKDFIKAYNERPVDEESAMPTIKYLTLRKPIGEYGLTQIRAMREELDAILDRNNINGVPLSNADKAAIKNDINELQKYLNYLRSNYIPKDNTERVFRVFEEMVINKQNEVSRILDAEGNTIGYEFPGVDGKPMRVTKLTEEIENKMTNKQPFLYDAIKEPYTDKDGKQKGGQLLNLFRELKSDSSIKSDADRLKLFMAGLTANINSGKLAQLKSQRKLDSIQKALQNNFTEEVLIAVVKDIVYSESTIAGNTIDTMTRAAFKINSEGGFVKPEKPGGMAQAAYDNLFGEFGIITELQDAVIDGKYTILSEDVIIYDSSLLDSGVVGAMDLIAFDNETGALKIIDIKTGKKENWDNFSKESEYSKKLGYTLQQSIYRALLFNMTGELAKSISILPIAITTDMDGNVLSAESAAKIVNNQAIRELRNKVLSLKQADKPNQDKIKELESKIKELERATTVPLEPISDATLAEYGVVMKAPVLPKNLKPEAIKQQKADAPLTEDQKKAEIKKLKTTITNLNKKIGAIPNGGMITVGDALVLSPEYQNLKNKKEQAEKQLAKLEGTSEQKDKPEDKIKSEIDALRGANAVSEVFPELESITSEEFKKILANIRNAKTLEELENAYNDAIVAIVGAEESMDFSDLVSNVYAIRKMALSTNLSQENIAVGEYLISKKPIFDGPAMQVVVVKEVKEDGKIVLNQVQDIVNGKPRKKTVTTKQLEVDFMKTTEEALKEQEEVMETTPEEKENSTISKSSIKDFADNPELINQAKENAAVSKKERLAALKNKSKEDNINNCKSN